MEFGSPFLSPKYTLIDRVRRDIRRKQKHPRKKSLYRAHKNNGLDLFILRSVFMHFRVGNVNIIKFILFTH